MQKLLTIVFIFAVLEFAHGYDTDYCGIVCKPRTSQGLHTLCKYPDPDPNCQFVRNVTISRTDKDLIVEVHNNLRSRVACGGESRGANDAGQPSASNMWSLKYDDDLQYIAQTWANQCVFKHDECRNLPTSKVGQNIYTCSSTEDEKPDWKKAITKWYGEVDDFNRNNINPFVSASGKATGHYTQLVWGATRRVGCGISYFMDGVFYKYIMVCNYATAGNVVGTPMYYQGPACQGCDTCSSDGCLCI